MRFSAGGGPGCGGVTRTRGHVDVHPGQAPAPDRLLDLCVALTPHSRPTALRPFPGRSNSRAARAAGERRVRTERVEGPSRALRTAYCMLCGSGPVQAASLCPSRKRSPLTAVAHSPPGVNTRRAHGHNSVAQEENRGAPCVWVCAALRMPSREFRVVQWHAYLLYPRQ